MTPMQQMGATASPDAQITLEDARKALHQLAANRDANAWQIGHLYNVIMDRKLLEQGGPRTSAKKFFQEFNKYDLSEITLGHYGAVVRAFPDSSAQRYGITTLYRLIAYLKAIHTEPPKGDPGAFLVKVPQPDGTLADKSFAYCTRDDMDAAIKHLKSPPPSLPQEEADQVSRAEAAIRKGLGEHTHITVNARKLRGHETEVELAHIPLSHLQETLEAILDALKSG